MIKRQKGLLKGLKYISFFNFLYDREFLLCENFYAPFYFG